MSAADITSDRAPRRSPQLGLTLPLLGVLGALTAFGPLSTDMYLPGLPSLAHDLRASAALVQLTISLCLGGLALGQLLVGPLSDSLGRRTPLLAGLAVYAAASVGCAVSASIGPLLALRLVQGAAGGAGIAIGRAVVRDRATGYAAARAYSTLMLVAGLGPVLAPVIGALLLHVTDWRGIFVALAVIGIVLLIMAAIVVYETLPAPARHRGGVRALAGSVGALVADRRYVAHTLASALALGTLIAYVAASPFVLERIHHLTPQTYSIVFGVNGCAIMLVRPFATRALRHTSPSTIMRRGLGVQASASLLVLCTVLMGLGLAPLLAGFLLAVGANGAILPMATALAMGDHPQRAGAASGVMGFVQFLLAAAVAPLVGLGGPHTAVPLAVIMPACSLTALAVLAATNRHPAPSSP